jgi:tetratricopeptide (TPR) repeat protein
LALPSAICHPAVCHALFAARRHFRLTKALFVPRAFRCEVILVAKQPSFDPINRGPRSQRVQVLERAALALRTQRFAEAEQLAGEVLRGSKTDIPALAILAQALIAQHRAGEAVAPLEKAVRRAADPGLETLLGTALGSAGRRTEAVDRLRQTASRRPAFAPAFQELANQLSLAGRNGEAIGVIEAALALLPGLIDLELVLARLHLVCNERASARAILARLHENAPGRTDIAIELARTMLRDGDYAAAADRYRHALGLNPDDALTRAELATCLLEMGERASGEAALRKAVHGRPQLLGRAAYALAVTSHGRFFLRPTALAKFLQA